MKIADARASVRDMLRAEEVELLVGHISRKVTLEEMVDEFIETNLTD